jgi:hypothetical protein
MYSKIIKVQKTDDHTRIEIDDNKSHPVLIKSSRIWSSIVWPQPEIGIENAYFLSFYEDYNSSGLRGVMHFIKELEFSGVLLRPFFDKLTDVCMRLYCDKIYTDIGNEAYVREFESYCRDKDILIRLESAPDHEYPHIGLSDIDEHGKGNKIKLQDDTLIKNDLSIFNSNTITDKKEMSKFYTVSGLRYIVTAYKKFGISHRRPDIIRAQNKRKEIRF